MEHSAKYEKIKYYYEAKFWTAQMVYNAANKGVITQEEAKEIIGEEGDI